MNKLFLQILFVQLNIIAPFTNAIRCYECSTLNSGDQSCAYYSGTTCGYGFFGCVKIATYDGGVDKMGNFINDPRALVSMLRGCQLLPLGGVDACQQQSILGYRIITCYCYSDYCNGTVKRHLPLTISTATALISAALGATIWRQLFLNH